MFIRHVISEQNRTPSSGCHSQWSSISIFLDMVIGLLSVVAIPTVIGVGQAVSAQKRQNAAAKEQEKFFIVPMLPDGRGFGDSAFCVLGGGKASKRTPRSFTL